VKTWTNLPIDPAHPRKHLAELARRPPDGEGFFTRLRKRALEGHRLSLYPQLVEHLACELRQLPSYVQREFTEYLRCGRLEYGFLRVRCADCHAEKRVAFSCKRRGFCPSCGARRMVESAALLVDEVIPHVPIRQWVLSVPYRLRFLFATHPQALGQSLGIVYRAIASFLIKKAGLTQRKAQCGALTLIQRFGSALNLNVHFHNLEKVGLLVRRQQLPGHTWMVGLEREGRGGR
jgi:ribosomal protein S27E